MALRRENYTQMGLCILVYVFSILSLSAQDQACPIWADLEPIADQRTATPTVYSQSVSIPFYDWEQLDSSRYSDDQYATVDMPGYKRSETAMFSRWGHKIPDGATIHGIKLAIEGHKTGSGSIRDVKVQLQGSNENKAGQFLGVAFPDSIDQVWRYGGASDTWGRNWTANQINSSNFGIEYQVRNSISGDATVHIDQITIEIFFTPVYTFCNDEHACVAFGVEEVAGYNYNWIIPQGFTRLSSLNEQHTVNIGVQETTGYGQYSICIDVYDEIGNFAENCCRTFKYQDCRPAIIGDLVFLDNNHDNQFSTGDDVVAGAVLTLFDEFDNVIASTITDENGLYQFEVQEGFYFVKLDLPEGLLPIESNIGSDNIDSDLDDSNGPLTTSTFFAGAGTTTSNVDIGLARELIVGDKAWEDKNYNGIQDSLEVGIANIEVLLLDTNGDTLQSTITDVNGIYGFDGIRVDDYEVRFVAADDYWATQQNLGSEDLDSDIDLEGSTGILDFDILDIPYLDLDAGFYRFASVGDYVFFDTNENGIQDASDEPLDSIVLTLSTVSGVEIASMLSNESGAYLFDSLVPGQYIISAEGSDLIKPTSVQQGNDITLDNDLHIDNGLYATSAFMLMSNESNVDIDLGWKDNLADLGGLVFEDIKYDGQYDDNDVLISNVTVTLVDLDGTIVQTQITESDGKYEFNKVLPGSYYIKFDVGSNFLFTQANTGDDTTDSDVTSSVENGSTDMMLVTVGMESFDIFAGIYRSTSIGDYVFLDLNEDGIQNDGDSGLSGIELALIDAQGSQLALDTTKANGAYLFDNLVPGEYTITLTTSDLYLETINGEGTSDTDSDLLEDMGQYFSDIITTCSGQEIDSIDFGFVNNYASVSGQVYEDSKADGVFNSGDTLLVNVPVTLYDTMNQIVQSLFTDSIGNFTFEDILAGEYYIVYGLSSEYNFSTDNVTDANGVGSTDRFILAPGEIVNDEITGAYILGSIGDYVFLDLDEDGIQSASDEGLSDVVLEIRNNIGDLVSTLESSSDGSYVFSDLLPGDYVINLVKNDLFLATQSNVGGSNEDSDLLEIGDQYISGLLTVCSGQQIDTIDFGFINNYAFISGQVYEDSKADAIFNTGDSSIVNVTVSLYNSLNEIVQSTQTNSMGNFTFEDVLAGDYYIVYGLSSEYIYSTTNVTETNGDGSTDVFTLAPGEIVNDENAGAYILGSIGDYVFLDIDEDGIQGTGDSGLSGVELSLLDESGEEVLSDISNADGSYNFDGLTPGVYTIALTNSDLYLSTLSNVGDDNLDSDITGDAGNYMSPSITICSGQSDNTIDFGFIIDYAFISGQVYEDSKADGLFNTGDTSIVNVIITLYNSLNEEVQTTQTNSMGNFTFEDVLAGDYYIVYGLSSEYIYSTTNVTETNGDGSTDVFTLAPGEIINDQNTGAYILGSIGDYVFLDLDEDGLQGIDDSGLSGVELSLLDNTGEEVQSDISNADGSYNFDGLTPGVYTIVLTNSDLYLATLSDAGDDDLDSDILGDAGNYMSPSITICSGQSFDNIDFGFVNDYAAISGKVYEDSKADRIFNAPDTALVSVPVTLYNSANQIVQSTTTDVNGNFNFVDIIAGDYYIVYDLGSQYIFSTDNVTGANALGSTNTITLVPGQVFIDQSTGAYITASIGDYVFLDLNEDGLQDAGDSGLEGIVLSILDMSGTILDMTTTGSDGSYTFDNLVPGNYVISVVTSDLYLPTQFNAGDAVIDSDLETIMGNYGSNTITVCSGQIEENIDFGFINNYATISGQVYEDSKADSLFNGIDTTIVNVTVTLHNIDNSVAQTTTTDANGNFVFQDVIGGDYYIIYGLDASYIYTSDDVTDAFGAGSTASFTLPSGGSRVEDAVGAYREGSIGDYVFLDLNEDGIQNETDQGLSDILLELFDSNGNLVTSTTTTSSGSYVFNGLTPGQYSIFVTASNLYLATLPNVGDENLDSDLLFGSGLLATDVITICSGEFIDSIDLGFVNDYAQISGSLFEDSKANGILDMPDTMKVGVVVDLYNASGTLVQTTMTAADGIYLFDDVLAGDYYILYNLSSDYIYSTVDVTGAFAVGSTDVFTLLPGESVANDATGAYRNTSIGDLVFLDKDDNGLQGADDTGLIDIQLTLYNDQGVVQGTITTDENGAYVFDNVTPGKYIIQLEFPDLYVPTTYQEGAVDLDSDLQEIGGVYVSDTITICSGQSFDNIDFGLANNYAKVGGVVFTDMMRDGQLSSIDVLLANIPVILYSEAGTEIESTVTDANGAYLFDTLLAENYYVTFDIADRLFTLPNVGDDATDSDVTESIGVGSTDLFTLTPGECNLTISAGAYELSSIGDFVWSDDNRNGLQDAGEPGIADVVVNLYNAADELIDNDITDENGIYGFGGLTPGMYYIEVEYPEDLTATINLASDLMLNSDISDGNGIGTTDLIALTSGIENVDIDAGLGLSGAEIHGEVWVDLDGDEMQSVGDTLLPGIPVKLFNSVTGAEVFATATNQNGKYSFKPIEDGSYYVQFQITDTLLYVADGLGDEAIDSDVDGTFGLGTTDAITVAIGDVIWDVDAGVEDGRSSVSGLIWIDKNGDGINDATEINLEAYTVNLHAADGTIVKTVMSNTEGTYAIEDVATGEYYITFIGLGDYVFTSADDAGDDTIDSDVTESEATGSTDKFMLGIQDSQVYDAGVYLLGSIGNFVWFDTDGNGVQDAGEPGVELANLTILDMDGEAVEIVNTETDGAYLFDGLAPGRYWIFMQAPLGLKATDYQIGSDRDIDSDLLTDGVFLLSDTIMIMSGQDDLSVDFGLVENPGTIQGFVWNDINIDGVFNDATSLFDAVTVELYKADGTLISDTMTDADGGYIFNDVSPDSYYLKFVLNANTTFTGADLGGNDEIDSDVNDDNGAATTTDFTIASGEVISNIYAGLIFPSKIGDLVFVDQNSNGLQDTDEPGIPMIKVILYDENGIKLDSVLTDVQGIYSFVDLDPANYYVEFVYPAAIQPTVALSMMPGLNSDITEANGPGTTDMVFLGSGECNEDIDGGFVPSGAAIVGEAWLDSECDHIQDNPNIPVEGIEVSLYSMIGGGTLVDGPVLTNELGLYGFSSIPTGSYYVLFNIPDSLASVIANVGPTDTDSDVTNGMGFGSTNPFIVLAGELYDNIDVGLKDVRSTIQGQLFVDSDADAVKDPNNQGLGGVDVTLFDDTNTAVANTVTTADGSYIFDNLQAGTYYIGFSNYPTTYLFTEADFGTDDTIDSDINDTFGTGTSASVVLFFDQTVSIDGGVYELASVGDYTWIDENNDGVQGASELPLEGILVEAMDDNMMLAGSATTDSDGMYLIDDLVPGTYNLIFTGVENYIPTIANLTSDDTLDSDINDINSSQAATGTFDLVSGENNVDFDGGYIFAQPSDGVISGVAWTDSDANGIREGSNPKIADMTILLFNGAGQQQDEEITNANGEYSFTGLEDGDYYVEFSNELGTSPTTPNVGSDLTDSDITMQNGGSSTDIINLGPSQVIENVDGGFISVGAIGNQIFVDINGNGRKGSNEPGLNGVTVKLYDSVTNMLLDTDISDSDVASMEEGFYQFNDVPVGTYYVVFELPTPYLFTDPNVGNEDVDSDVTGATNGFVGSTDVFSLSSGQVREDIDAGAFLPAKVGDFVWNDLDEDGIQDPGEPGMANITVELRRSNTMLIATTTTDNNGNYCFDGLKQGLYFVEFDVPVGFVVTEIYQGDSALDSDIDATGTTPLVSIAHGSTFLDVDAGFYSQSINNLISHVWFDKDADGLYEVGESSIKDVVISLLDDQGSVMAQTTTNHGGKYAFIDIPVGDYQVAVGIDDGFATTIMNAGNDDWLDSDVDDSGMSAMFTVDNGLSVPNIDIGMIEDDGFAPEITVEEESISEVEIVVTELMPEEDSPVSFVSGPNPFYNRVQVRMSRPAQGVEYGIYRLDGALIQSGAIVEKDHWIELGQQNDGMYILIVTHNQVPVDKQFLMKVN